MALTEVRAHRRTIQAMRFVGPFIVVAGVVMLAATTAQATRPTPHQLIERALRPIREQLDQLNASEAERREIADLLAQGEALAAEIVEARHRGATTRTAFLMRRMEWLARVARGRIEAARAEAQAVEHERQALEAEARRVQARAALERAIERRLEAERMEGEPSTAGGTR